MKALLGIVILTFALPLSVDAWWDTKIDTIETKYPDSSLRERYERSAHSGNERIEKTGFYRIWHPSGQLKEEGHYWCDGKTDVWVGWDSTGKREYETNFDAGVKHGRETTWNPNGTTKSLAIYRHGKLHGVRTIFTAKNTVGGYMNNPCLSVELQEFYIDGALVLTLHGEDDKPCRGLPCGSPENPYYSESTNQWVELRSACKEFYVGTIADAGKQGKWVLWSADGYPLRTDLYENDSLVTR